MDERDPHRYRIVPHPNPRPADLALAPTRATAEAAIADMGDGVVIGPNDQIVAFHERHLTVIERRAKRSRPSQLP